MDDLQKEEQGPGFGTWLYLILGLCYAFSPIDVLPDFIPVAGWFDDLVITGSAVLNFAQAEVEKWSSGLASLISMVKWIVLLLGIVIILLIVIIGGLCFGIFSK